MKRMNLIQLMTIIKKQWQGNVQIAVQHQHLTGEDYQGITMDIICVILAEFTKRSKERTDLWITAQEKYLLKIGK